MRLDGAVDQAEYAKMKLEYDPILDRAPRVNLVWQLGAGLTVEPSVMWDDMKLALSRADRLGRLALVADDRWGAIVEIAVESGQTFLSTLRGILILVYKRWNTVSSYAFDNINP